MNIYERYKDSGIPWLGEVPEHWEIVPIRYLFQFKNNLRIPLSAEERGKIIEKIYPYYGASGIIDYVDNFIFDEDLILVAEDGANLLSRSTPLAFIATGKYWVNNHAHILKPLSHIIKFWQYLLQIYDFLPLISGSAQPKLTKDNLASILLPTPPVEEQTAIAHYLDTKLGEIDALIGKQQTLLEKLAEQRTAVITHAVTKGLNPAAPMKNSGVEWLGDVPAHWEIIKNKYILEFSKGLTITKENLINDGIPCVSYGEIHSKYGFEVNPEKHFLKCVSEEYLENNDHAYLKNGDFVFADTSEDVKGSGNFTYLNSNLPIFAGYHTIVARPNLRKVLPRFLAYVFDSNAHRNQIRAMVKGVKVFSITQAFLKNTFSWLPSKKEQTAIAEYLDQETAKIDRLCDTVNQTIGRLKEYRTALITQAVTGKIKVTDE